MIQVTVFWTVTTIIIVLTYFCFIAHYGSSILVVLKVTVLPTSP